MSSSVLRIQSEGHFRSLVDASESVLSVVKVSAPWCKVCKKVAVPFSEFAAQTANRVQCLELDTSELEELSISLGVKKLPFFIFLRGGEATGNASGSNWDKVATKINQFLCANGISDQITPGGVPQSEVEPAKASAGGGKKATPISSPLPAIVRLSSEAHFRSLTETTEFPMSVVKASAPWCKACKKVAKPFAEFASQNAGSVQCLELDTSQLEQLSVSLGVKKLPSFLLVSHGSGDDVAAPQVITGSKWPAVLEQIKEALAANNVAVSEVTLSTATAAATATAESKAAAESSSPPPAAAAERRKPCLPAGATVLNVAQFPGGFTLPFAQGGNSGGDGGSRSASEVARGLQGDILGIYSQFLRADGNAVDYGAMLRSDAFAAYVAATAELQTVSLASLSQSELKCFSLNLYNALCVHAQAVLGHPDPTVKGSIGAFFTTSCYVIGGVSFSLDELEHGILRGNQVHPSTGTRPFPDGDDRASLALPLDPRVHCALVCGAKSCPPIRLFRPENLDAGLTLAASSFCDSEVTLPSAGGAGGGEDGGEGGAAAADVIMSKIFMWYGSDFGDTQEARLRWLLPYLSDGKRAALAALLDSGKEIRVEYKEYDWSQNSTQSSNEDEAGEE